MKTHQVFGVSLLLATAAFGQFRPTYNTYGSNSGFGSVVFPGTGHPPNTFSITNPGFAGRLGATVNGSGIGNRGFGQHRRAIGVLPYAYPVAIGGYGYDPYLNGAYAAQPNVTVVAPPQQQAPQIIINQSFGSGYAPDPAGQPAPEGSGFHMYQSPSASYDQQPAEPRYYLIAYKDHSVYPALAYWLEDNTLHYVTTQNTHNQASLDLIDLDFTKRLNQDRNVQFSLTQGH